MKAILKSSSAAAGTFLMQSPIPAALCEALHGAAAEASCSRADHSRNPGVALECAWERNAVIESTGLQFLELLGLSSSQLGT